MTVGSEWRWRYESGPWPSGWTSVGFDDSGWSTGVAPFGFGSDGIVTNIDVPPPTTNRPISAQFRRTFEVADPSAYGSLVVTARVDDGVVVYVNGVEVGRANLPATGPITHDATWALSGPSSAAAAANPVTFTVPASLLVPGKNQIAVQTQLGWRTTPNVSFDARIVAVEL